MKEMENTFSPLVEGVGLVLYDGAGRLFIVFEGKSKPLYDKEVGDPSIPWETRERIGGCLESYEQALQRALDEEVGLEVRVSEISVLFQFTTSFGIPQTIYRAKFDDAIRMGGTAVETGELLGWEWIFPEDLVDRRMRGGMREIINAYAHYSAAAQRA